MFNFNAHVAGPRKQFWLNKCAVWMHPKVAAACLCGFFLSLGFEKHSGRYFLVRGSVKGGPNITYC